MSDRLLSHLSTRALAGVTGWEDRASTNDDLATSNSSISLLSAATCETDSAFDADISMMEDSEEDLPLSFTTSDRELDLKPISVKEAVFSDHVLVAEETEFECAADTDVIDLSCNALAGNPISKGNGRGRRSLPTYICAKGLLVL